MSDRAVKRQKLKTYMGSDLVYQYFVEYKENSRALYACLIEKNCQTAKIQ